MTFGWDNSYEDLTSVPGTWQWLKNVNYYYYYYYCYCCCYCYYWSLAKGGSRQISGHKLILLSVIPWVTHLPVWSLGGVGCCGVGEEHGHGLTFSLSLHLLCVSTIWLLVESQVSWLFWRPDSQSSLYVHSFICSFIIHSSTHKFIYLFPHSK